MDFNSNDFLSLTTQQASQLKNSLSSGTAGKASRFDANGQPIVDLNSSTLKETEGKKFDSNSFNFISDKNIVLKDEKESSIADLATKFFGMFKSKQDESEKIG